MKEKFVIGLVLTLFLGMIASNWNVDRKQKYNLDPVLVLKNLHNHKSNNTH